MEQTVDSPSHDGAPDDKREPYRPDGHPFERVQLQDIVVHPDVDQVMQVLGVDPSAEVAWCKPLSGEPLPHLTLPLDELERDDNGLLRADPFRKQPEGFRIHRLFKVTENFHIYKNDEKRRNPFNDLKKAVDFVDEAIADEKRSKVGYWCAVTDNEHYRQLYEHLPHPDEYVNADWDGSERSEVVEALRELPFPDLDIRQYRGLSPCRVCGKRNGSKEFRTEQFRWPEGYLHYVEEHQVKPPQEFIDYLIGAGYSK